MPLFVVLGNFTQKKMENIKDHQEHMKAARKIFMSYGVRQKTLVFTMGRYDLVGIFEAPNTKSISKALLKWGSTGLLRTETLTAFTGQEISELVKGFS